MSSAAAKKHYDNGTRLLKSGKLPEAEAALAEAIALDEGNAEYWIRLGQVWIKQTRHGEAKEALQMAATLQPGNSDALYQLGLAHIELDQTDAGLGFIEQAFALKPQKDLAMQLGDLFTTRENHQLAAYFYLKARKLDPNDANLADKLATSLYHHGDTISALAIYLELVTKYPTNRSYINTLAQIYRKFDHKIFDERAYKVILTCLKTENVKYRNFGPAWGSLMMLDPNIAGLRSLADGSSTSSLDDIKDELGNEFLCIGLENLPILNIEAEIFLTQLRHYFLINQADAATWPKETLKLLTSLAIQCWYNDFVFYESAEEIPALKKLEERARAIATSGTEQGLPEALLLSLYACYRPLASVKDHGVKLPLGKSMLYEMKTLIKVQIQNPEREAEIIPTIPDFTEITDDVSRAVQDMYAKRPYPRWKSTNKEVMPPQIADLSRGINILVAGCGTGQEPSLFANSMPYAKTTAIDLSLPSIAYGKRMAEEIGFASKIDFMHGDLMEVAKIGRTFDLVVSSGVLHHMKEPEKGFKAILDTMKPGGRINISLYSKIARDHALGPASSYIEEHGYSSSDDDIRKFRQDIFKLPEDDPARRCVRASDFYMLSECNDLLFHVQEHRMTFPIMKEMSARLGLEMFHIYMSPQSLNLWKAKFPGETGYDFDKLHEFEQENPDTFLEMYKMYFRRVGDTSTHPLDQLIKSAVI